MSKEEIIEKYCEKYKINKDSLVKTWKEFEETGKSFGYAGEDLEKHCENRLIRFFAKRKLAEGDLHKVAIVGINITDFGKEKIYNSAKEAWDKDPEKAIENGKCNEDGEPLFLTGKMAGKVMIKETLFTKLCYGIKQLIVEGEEHSWKPVMFSAPVNLEIPVGCIAEVPLQKGRSDNQCYLPKDPVFSIKTKLTFKQMLDLAKEHFEELKLKDMTTWLGNNTENKNAICYSIVDLAGIDKTRTNNSNIVEICDPIEDSDEPTVVTGWVSKCKELPLDIMEGAENLVVFHSPWSDSTNVHGIYAEDKFKKKINTENIEPQEEKTNNQKPKDEGWEDI